jgi:hypothetical protein
MELDFTFLAEKGGTSTDGKIFCFGAGIDAMVAVGLSFPVHLPPFSLIARFIVQPHEVDERHVFQIQIENPKGELADKSTPAPIVTKKDDYDESQPTGAIITANMHIIAMNPGLYRFHVLLDGRDIKSVPLRIISEPAPPVADPSQKTEQTES